MTKHMTRLAAPAAALVLVLAHGAHAGEIPSYYEYLDFNFTGPGAFTQASGGFSNPSVYSMVPGSELEFFWTNYDDNLIDRWGLFTGLEHLGFGVVHDRLPGSGASVTDYRLGFSGGTRQVTLGLAYGWSGGDKSTFDREDLLQLGFTWRINRYVSLGGNQSWGMSTSVRRGLFDLAVRPIGNDRLTLFGDLETHVVRGDYDSDIPWSMGAMVEVPAGLKLIGRFMDSKESGNTFNLALAYSFGGGFNQGILRGSVQEHFDDDSKAAATVWGLRIGYPERSELFKSFNKNSGYVKMHPRGEIVYSTYRFFDSRVTLENLLDAIDDARTDDRVAGIALDLSGSRFTRGQAWEVRERLGELRSVGKKVVVYLDEAGTSTYYLASCADHIIMHPEGMLMLPGYVIGRTYIPNLLDKLGLGFEEFRFLKYKSAVETLARHEMSEADREQRQALVDEYYNTFRSDVAEGRHVSNETVDNWINDQVMFTGELALKEKLVDELGSWDAVKKRVKEIEGESKSFVGTNSLADRWYPSKQWGERDKIAVVYAIGACDMDSGIQARRLEKTLRSLRGRKDVKAVVLRVDSPGGSPLASDVVAGQMRELMKKKPVVVSQGDVAASGGYWLSMCSHQIVAEPTTITGSIGVIAGWVWDKGIGEKVGMEGDFVKRGKHADVFFSLKPPYFPVGIPHRAVTEEERKVVLDGMTTLYDRFVSAVATNRKMDQERVASLAQGRVWTGVAARENGLVDRIGGLQDAIMVARELARIGPEDDAQVVEFAPRGLFRFDIPGNPLGTSTGGLTGVLSLNWSGLLANGWRRSSEPAESAVEDYGITYLRHIVEHNGRAQCMIPPDMLPRDGE